MIRLVWEFILFTTRFLYSVVEIFAVSRIADRLHLWGTPVSEESWGSGFAISGRRLLTNAHVVMGATIVEVKKLNSGTKFKAKVKAFGHECDLALLTVESEHFREDLEPLELIGSLPHLSQAVTIVGYPMVGESICLTNGQVGESICLTSGQGRERERVWACDDVIQCHGASHRKPKFVSSESGAVRIEC